MLSSNAGPVKYEFVPMMRIDATNVHNLQLLLFCSKFHGWVLERGCHNKLCRSRDNHVNIGHPFHSYGYCYINPATVQ